MDPHDYFFCWIWTTISFGGITTLQQNPVDLVQIWDSFLRSRPRSECGLSRTFGGPLVNRTLYNKYPEMGGHGSKFQSCSMNQNKVSRHLFWLPWTCLSKQKMGFCTMSQHPWLHKAMRSQLSAEPLCRGEGSGLSGAEEDDELRRS